MRRLTLAFLAAAAIAAPALAAGGIALQGQNPLSETADAFPRIVNPTGPKIERINQALGRADARAKKAIKDCGKGKDVEYERAVTAPMTGQPFLSLVASDFAFCGGAHPNSYQTYLTYDLGTGRPISWGDYLPADLVQPEVLLTGMDETQIGAVKAPALIAWYRARVRAANGGDKEWMANCNDVLDGDLALVLWIDAKAQGMSMQIADLPHVVAACNESVVMKTDELRRRGAKPALTDAIDAAKKGKNWQ